MGVNVKAAANNGNLYADKVVSKTTIMALEVDNFNTNLKNREILERIVKVIDKYEYYGIIVQNSNGSASWQVGNVTWDGWEKSISKADAPKPQDLKPEPKEHKPDEPKAEDTPKRIDLKILTQIVRSLCSMSDTFFDGVTKVDRQLVLRELESLCEDPGADIERIIK